VQQNAAASEQLASTSEEVSSQAMELQSMMEFFTLAGGVGRGQASIRGQKKAVFGSAKARKPETGNVDEQDFTRF
jgi:methyl-accepting chemotaxis protein